MDQLVLLLIMSVFIFYKYGTKQETTEKAVVQGRMLIY